MENYQIDFVIPWVDDQDPEWKESKNQYWGHKLVRNNTDANNDARFRDWNTLKYWFRAVEKFAPWVNKVYFVTCGHIPEWLNLEHPKLVHVKHSDYIPQKYLPVFSANPIEINFHRIPGLSEHFVYFNDDMFLTNYVKPEDFFVNGLPREIAIQYPLSNNGNNDTFQHMLLTMAGQLNAHFDLRRSISENKSKWYNLKYGKLLIHNIMMSQNRRVSGLVIPHVPTSLRKSTMCEVWDTITPFMEATCQHRFRNPSDITQYIFRYWEILKGTFEPTNIFKYAEEYHLEDDVVDRMCYSIRNKTYKMICVNDSISVDSVDDIMLKVQNAFDEILPDKSEFEK